jgi:hypothetical protein
LQEILARWKKKLAPKFVWPDHGHCGRGKRANLVRGVDGSSRQRICRVPHACLQAVRAALDSDAAQVDFLAAGGRRHCLKKSGHDGSKKPNGKNHCGKMVPSSAAHNATLLTSLSLQLISNASQRLLSVEEK